MSADTAGGSFAAPRTPGEAITESFAAPRTPGEAITESFAAPRTPGEAITESFAAPRTPGGVVSESSAAPSTPGGVVAESFADSPLYRRGFEEAAAGRFFEAHEEWEGLWMKSAGVEKLFLQALIQTAAGAVHLQRGRGEPAGRLLALALAKLERYPERYGDLDVLGLRALLGDAPEAIRSDPARLLTALRSIRE